MEFVSVSESYLEEAVKLAMKEYEDERHKCTQLIQNDFTDSIKELIRELFKCQYGVAAVEEGKLIGYLAFWNPSEQFFGVNKGVFSPLGGNAFGGNDRGKLASLLFEKAADKLVQDKITSIAICRYDHDKETEEALIFNGFGIRCSDAIRSLNTEVKIKNKLEGVSFFELSKKDYAAIRPLKMGLVEHLSNSPIFYPTDLSNIERWFNNSERRTFAAKKEGEIIGYIEVTEDGETFITENKKMLNICGAFFNKEYRGKGIAEALLTSICKRLKEEGIDYLGVDCETLNPNALRFWGKNFENYTYSFHRRIDERIVGYSKYLKNI